MKWTFALLYGMWLLMKESHFADPGTAQGDDAEDRADLEEMQGKNRLLERLESTVRHLEEKIRRVEEAVNERKSDRRFPSVALLNYAERKRILVTGGAGFVGAHLVEKLMLQGHEVTVVDNFYTGRKRSIDQWIGHGNFELINHDIVNPLFLEVDEIYHLASPASPPHYMMNPVKTIKTNMLGTINMLGLAKRVGARILLASTSEVYGDPKEHPQNENYWGNVNPVGPRACYDEGKRIAEALVYAYMLKSNVAVRIARIFNTYGPGMHLNDGRVVSNFILQALRGHPMTIYGSGKQTRSFQYISDLVEGLVQLMSSNYSSPVNIGNPTEVSVKDLAVKIREIVNDFLVAEGQETQSEIVHLDPQMNDPQQRKPDISLALKVLGWSPLVGLDEGLKTTIRYFRSEIGKKVLQDPKQDAVDFGSSAKTEL